LPLPSPFRVFRLFVFFHSSRSISGPDLSVSVKWVRASTFKILDSLYDCSAQTTDAYPGFLWQLPGRSMKDSCNIHSERRPTRPTCRGQQPGPTDEWACKADHLLYRLPFMHIEKWNEDRARLDVEVRRKR
jgi:hypothetical protein